MLPLSSRMAWPFLVRLPLPEIVPDSTTVVASLPPPILKVPPAAPSTMALSMVIAEVLLVSVPPLSVSVPEDR
ncbi:hypothetical protein D9M68_339900 [compost metagenome]